MKRVVITGIGIMASNGSNRQDFTEALRNGRSGIRFIDQLKEWNYRCQVAGVPEMDETILSQYLPEPVMNGLKSSGIKYACLSSIEAYLDAGLTIDKENTDWDMGCIFGCSMSDLSYIKTSIPIIESGQPRNLGTRYVEQAMASGASAYLAGLFGLGNHVYSNSSACSTGTESILMSYDKIRSGTAKRMLAGSCESTSPYIWAGFDAMRVMCQRYNDNPTGASRPLSGTAGGFVPGGGAAALILEDLESALERGAKIYGEILGGAVNSGGQRSGGTMTAPNRIGVQRCITNALRNADIQADQIDLICGHLTATMGDKIEVDNWATTLNRRGRDFPHINSSKSMLGHCLSAAGSIESAAAVLQLHHNFVHPSINSEDLHPGIAEIIDRDCVPMNAVEKEINYVIKANFGFGDVNSCIIFSKYRA